MVRSSAGEFLFTVGPPGFKFLAAEVEFTYNVAVSGDNYTESLQGCGTLNESISIEVCRDIRDKIFLAVIILEVSCINNNCGFGMDS